MDPLEQPKHTTDSKPQGQIVDLNGNVGPWGQSSQIPLNPLSIVVGSKLRLHDPDLHGLEVRVEEVLGTTVNYDGQRYYITDYAVIGAQTPEASSLSDNDGNIRLRIRCCAEESGALDTTIFQAQHLQQAATPVFTSLASSEGLASLISARGRREYGFERIDDVHDIYRGERTVIGEQGLVTTHIIETLDYSRMQPDGKGDYYSQWALVEHNPETHDMITLFGWSIAPESIERLES